MGLGLDQPSHWVIIAVVALLLFGYKKLPEMARSAGRSMRIFKTELKGMANDDDTRAADAPDAVAAPAGAGQESDAKSAELAAAEAKAATLRAELAAAEAKAAQLKAADPHAASAEAVPADGVVPRAS